MKHSFLRRLGALALALVLALSGLALPAMAANPTSIRIRLDEKVVTGQITVEQDQLIKLECIDQSGNPAKVAWSKDGSGVTLNQSGGVRGKTPGSVTKITATALDENGDPVKVGNREVTATCTVAVRMPIPATGVTLNQTALRLNPGDTAQLTATVAPANADDKTLAWSVDCDPLGAVTVDDKGLITAVSTNNDSATVTVKVVDKTGTPVLDAQGEEVKAQCAVYVREKPSGFIIQDAGGVDIPNGGILELEYTDKGVPNRLRVTPTPKDAVFTYDSVVWGTVNEAGAADQSVIRVVKDPASFDSSGRSAVVTAVGPGIAKLTVASGDAKAEWTVEISGITLRGNTLQITGGKLSLWENQIEQLVIDTYGSAKNANMASVRWESSDPSIVDVYGGRLTARTPGTVKVTATLEGYDAAVLTVTVQEDTSALVQAPGVIAGDSVKLSTVGSQLNTIAVNKTGSALSHITNLSVATEQGILHDSHRSEADTGAGVGSGDRYYLSGNRAQGRPPLSDLSFVARSTFTGNADISYTGVTTDNQYFTGTIRVAVAGTQGIHYSAVTGQAVGFQTDDFNRICQSKQGGRSLNYVTFTLPQASWGELRYDYSSPTHTGQAVTGGTQYYRTRTPSLDRVSFIPSSTCPSSITISYRGTDTNGGSYSGVVSLSVTKQSGGYGSADVHYTARRGEKAAFNAAQFNAACMATVGETLSYVRFSLPSSEEGTLYLNYWGPGSYSALVNAGTSYYVAGTPGLSAVSFVSTSVAPDQVAIPYTGYSTRGTAYTGTVYIELDDASQTGIRYSVVGGKAVYFNVNDFNNACINATGASLNYVRFNSLPAYSQGSLRYRYVSGSNYGSVSTSTSCYRVNPNSSNWTTLISNIYFQADTNYTGTVTLSYTGYSTNGTSYTGEVAINVTPNIVTYTGTNAFPLQINASQLASACAQQMSKPLSYIMLNNLPAATAGRIYVGYTKVGSGYAANTGTAYHVSGSPNISQLSFVPRGRYEGQVEVGYTAVSTSNERVTGRIIFNIVAATGSRYFGDMGNHVWAASAADYLRLNEVSNGFGGSTTFGPAQKVMRRDFMVMLDRAFRLPSAGSSSFSDVPTNQYYSKALASAKQMGIVSSADNKFRPNDGLTREDAMVMIYNTLAAIGKNPPRGTEADLARFTDNRSVSSYARNAVASLVQMGVIRGSNGQLNPKETITRAESAMILHYVLTM